MKRASKLKWTLSFAAVAVAGFLFFFTYHFGPADTSPRRIASEPNSDGSLLVVVSRRKGTWFCTASCTDVTVEIYNKEETLLYQDTIRTTGFWQDTDGCYSDVLFHSDGVEIGPVHREHSEAPYYRIDRGKYDSR
jgi:hypothetical protein